MLRIALGTFRRHKLRSALTGISVVLGVSFIAGTFMFTDSINATLDGVFANVYEGVDVSVRPQEGDLGATEDGFDSALLKDVLEVQGVAAAEGGVQGIAQLLGQDGELIGGQGPPALGFSWVEDVELTPVSIAEGNGRAPLNADEIVIDVNTAEFNNFAVGDMIAALSDGPQRDYTIVGIVNFGEADSLAGATLALFELEHAQEIFGLEGKFSYIDVRSDGSVSPEELQQRVSQVVPDGLEVVTGEAQADEQLQEFSDGLSFLTTALLAFAGVSVFVGSFTIQNTFRIIVAQRTKELALLRAVGASKLQVLQLVLVEALIIGGLASVIGIIGGVGIAYGVRGMLDAIGFGLPAGPIELAPRTVAVSLTVGIGVTVLAALLPALKASRVTPIEALRESQTSDSRKSLFTRGVIGLIMIVLGGAALLYGLGGNASNAIYYVGFGAVIQFIGVSVIAPLLSVPIANSFGSFLAKTRGVVGQIAARNAARSPRRTASTAAALMIGVSLIAFVSILATSFKVVVDDLIAETFSADVTIFNPAFGPTAANFPVEVETRLTDVEELDIISSARYALEGFEIQGDEGAFILAGIDPVGFDRAVAKLKPSEGAYEQLEGETIVVRDNRLEALGKQVGDTITIRYAEGAVDYTVVGTFVEAFDSDYLINNDEYIRYLDDEVTIIGATYVEGVDPGEAKVAVEVALAEYPQVNVNDSEDLIQQARQSIDEVLALLWGLLAMAVISAVFGITNTLLLSISERTREIGLLRAVGMTRPQMKAMIRYESVVIALFGSLLGLVMGVFFAWAVIGALRATELDQLGLEISYGQLVLYFAFATLAGVLAAIWPARKAAKMDILKAISYE